MRPLRAEFFAAIFHVPMKRLGLALGLALAVVATARPETLTVATYNVENYGVADRMTAEGYRPSYPKPEAEKTALRAVIRQLNADILILQEMGSADYLEELRRDLAREGCEYAHAYVLEGMDAERHVALLARRAPKAIAPHADLAFDYLGKTERVKRGLLEVTFATIAGDVTVFGVHLKSRFTDRPDDPNSAQRRAGEAGAVRDAVLARFPDPSTARFLIVGDCNDGRTGQALQRLLRRGTTTVARPLPAADTRGETWTHAYRKEGTYSGVDHILVSPGLESAVSGGKARIQDGPETLAASDHRPVVVTLELDPRRLRRD